MQIQQIWNKFNSRERLSAIGALVIGAGWIISLAAPFGLGGNGLAVVGAIVVLVILVLKYAPNENLAWPAPPPLINLGISGLVLVVALLALLGLGISGLGLFNVAFIAAIVTVVGAGMMVWGAWREYRLAGPASPSDAPGPTVSSSSGSAPSTLPPPPAPSAQSMPPAAPEPDDRALAEDDATPRVTREPPGA